PPLPPGRPPAPWTVYAMNWSVRPDKRFRLALGSFVEEYNNKVGTGTAPPKNKRARGDLGDESCRKLCEAEAVANRALCL
uniref:Uncharacterized protein n=1 Tax=Anas platyrhynchos platyrhynchos TaxID=8840 RepID=A0A493T1K4_ANAPP